MNRYVMISEGDTFFINNDAEGNLTAAGVSKSKGAVECESQAWAVSLRSFSLFSLSCEWERTIHG